jgi:hypothetical protein
MSEGPEVRRTADRIGPILRFTRTDPAKQGSIERLGPDALVEPFPRAEVRARLADRGGKTLADLLLDQS